MKMKKGNMPTLVFLLLAGLTATAAIVGAQSPDAPSPPWKCCDNIEMLPVKIFPPKWRCNDELKPSVCVAQCEVCQEAPGPFPGPLICSDVYQGENPGPFCTPRPWGDCCDRAICTKSIPPICHCDDEVEKCAAACKDCKLVESPKQTPPRYVCQDQFTGNPGPRCTPDEVAKLI